ncbi:LemA family protein [Myroides pelagicus]|uniref:LemA family protein n=1 Tax=Myroides pelagicus TaxID=270914 RepID=A0A7K1GL22_9FLAO|nr:LemA family protein [Myroides pelagicus]MEC4113991.1 LemA family protein [Myroides pelagicus]MTH29592.1 LemA family protein [Myroides pelagicus]
MVSAYNSLAKRKNQIQNAISSLDALFMQRADLIPNLVATVKKYMSFEQDLLEKITSLRSQVVATAVDNPYLNPEEASAALKQLLVQVENYPELKSNAQFSQLNYAFMDCEEQIAAGRRFLSASITSYNNAVVVFPSNLIANLFGFKKYEWVYATEEQKAAPNAADLLK